MSVVYAETPEPPEQNVTLTPDQVAKLRLYADRLKSAGATAMSNGNLLDKLLDQIDH